MRSLLAILAVATIASSAVAASSDALQKRGEERLAKALAGMTPGTPVDCINFRDIQSTEIIDRTAILYRTSGRRVYVNRPEMGAQSLGNDDILVTSTSLSQLCRIDTVHLVDRGSQFQRGFVGLGKFVPYTKPRS